MTLREAPALILLFQTCWDDVTRRRALELVPELKDFDEARRKPFPVDVVVDENGVKRKLYGA